MSGGRGGKAESFFTREGLPPIEFGDFSSRDSPMFKVGTRAESGDDVFYFFIQGHHGPVIQMIPVIVGDNQIIDFRHISNAIHIGTRKSFRSKR